MRLSFEISGRKFSIDTGEPLNISIPLLFNGEQPNTYDVDMASAKAYETGDFIGDTRRGGGCNFEEYRLIPHCNGTHTEGVGHISLERISIHDILKDVLIPSTLITVTPEKAGDTRDGYVPEKGSSDLLITRKSIEDALKDAGKDFLKGLIVRTLPNDDSKKSRRYMDNLPPFFSNDAIKYITSMGVDHLLMDIPSVDRTFDEGRLTSHHIFWDVKQGSHEVPKEKHSLKTITEMIYAPDNISDGHYMMNIQIPEFVADAAPSRIILFKTALI